MKFQNIFSRVSTLTNTVVQKGMTVHCWLSSQGSNNNISWYGKQTCVCNMCVYDYPQLRLCANYAAKIIPPLYMKCTRGV